MEQEWAAGIFEKIKVKLKAECERNEHVIPHVPRGGRYRDLDAPFGISWWTNGFWPGMLWQMYNATGDEQYRAACEEVEKRLDEAFEAFEDLSHDVGFMWLHTAAADYRLTGNKDSRRRALHAANILAGRYNPSGKFIRAPNGGGEKAGCTIIDSMMNLPLLHWASEETGDPRFKMIAMEHAYTAMNRSVRPDGSCNHDAVLSVQTGELLETPGGQGYAPGSSWSRGQSWGLYGFALSYRHTGEQKFLDTAKMIAHYVIANFALNGWLPLVDFRSPPKPVIYDSNAAMISACGLLEIAAHVPEYEKVLYTRTAMKILTVCEKAFADWNSESDGIIGNGTGSYHGYSLDGGVNYIYGDYFFIEAVLRLLGKDFLIW